jgi:Xaa-Pro aminopeptidase
VYNAVLRVFRSCVKNLTAGKKMKEWQREAEQSMEKELADLKLLTPKQIRKQDPENPAFKRYFMHGVGHPLGLDVHDVGPTIQPMQAGWVMTVEPAIYVREEGFAVRLENNVLLTKNGPVDLMAQIPIEADEIEELMAPRAKPFASNGKGHEPVQTRSRSSLLKV